MDVVDHSCPTCGAVLNFNPSTQSWICEYCKVQYSLESLSSNINKYNNISVSSLEEIECTNCGAKVVTDSSTSSTTCTYCNSSVIIKKRLVGEFKPDYIIPFNKTQKQVVDIFLKHLKSKWLCPNNFKDKGNIKSITGLYVPFWVVSTSGLASIKGLVFTDSSTRRFSRMGVLRVEEVPVDGKSNLDNDLLKGILPFDYSNIKKFEYPYLAGFFAERFDEDQKAVYETQIKDSIREVMIEKLTSTVSGFNKGNNGTVEQVTFHADDFTYKYVLVPVWFVKFEYEGKIYEYCINDNTNKISGKYPVSKIGSFSLYLYSFILSLIVIIILDSIILGAIFLSALLTISANYIRAYSKIKKGEEITKYVNDNSFKLVDKQDMDSF